MKKKPALGTNAYGPLIHSLLNRLPSSWARGTAFTFLGRSPSPLAKNVFLRLLLVSTFCCLASPAVAAVYRNWTGAVSGSWSNPNNWDPIGLPQEGDDLWFYADANKSTINDIPNLIVNTLVFSNNEHVLSGNPLTVGSYSGGIFMTMRYASVTINCALILHTNSSIFKVQCWPFLGNSVRLRFNADVNLNGSSLLLYSFAPGEGGSSAIEMAGSISGNGNVTARASGYPQGTIEFLGTANNIFTGTLFVERHVSAVEELGQLGLGVYFNKQGGSVVTNRLEIRQASYLHWRNSNQIGDNATVVISDGSRMDLNGYNDTIGNLVLTNVHADADASMVDTVGGFLGAGVGTLTVNDGIVSRVHNPSIVPTIRGILNLPARNHNFFVSAANYDGLNLEAQVTGLGGFTKYGNGALLLNGTNTFGGTVYAGSGIIDVYNPAGFGSPAGGVVLMGGSVTLRGLTIASETLFARGQEIITAETAGSLLSSVGSSAWSGAIALDTNLVVSGGDMLLTGPISGPGGLDFRTFGTAQLGGSLANTYTGTTLVRCPLLELNKPLGVNAYAGPLEVGGGAGGPYEVRWLNSYQNPNTLLTVYANGLVNLNGQNENFGPVTFNGGTVQTGTGFFMTGYPITANPAATTATMNGNLSLSVSPAYFVVSNGVADPDLRINSAISGVNVTKQGQGTLTLAGANTHSGSTFAAEGILHADNSAAFGTLAGNTIVANGATIRLGGIDGMTEAFQLNGAGFQGTNGALQITVRGGGTMYGGIFLSIPSTINCLGGLAIDSVISGTGPLTKTGPGNFFLGGLAGGAGNNTYSGSTIVTAGALYLSKNQNVRSVPGPLVVGPATAAAPATARFSRTGTMPAGGTVTVNANSLLDLNGNNQTLASLNLYDGGDAQTGAGQLTFAAGGVVTVGTLNSPQVGLLASSSIGGKVGLPVLDYLTFNVGGYGPAPFVSDAELVVPAVISGGGNIIKNGAGSMNLSGANTFNDLPPNVAGDLYINSGTVIAGSPRALGGTAGWTLVYNGARLALVGNITVTNETHYLNSTNTTALDNPGGDNTWTGPITLARDSAVGVNLDWSLATIGVISGSGSLTKRGGGTLRYGGSAHNTYAGNTFVHEGTLALGKTYGFQAVPASLIVGQSSGGVPTTVRYLNHDQIAQNITVNGGGLLDLNGFDGYEGSLTLNGGGNVQTGNGALYVLGVSGITVNPSGNNSSTISGRLGFDVGKRPINVGSGVTSPGAHDLVISAAIFHANPPVSLEKAGAGSLRFTGTNTHTGTNFVLAGRLQVDGFQPQSRIHVNGGTLQGTGTIGQVNFSGIAGIVAPGASPGILTCSNFNAGAFGSGTLQAELNGTTAGSGYDQVKVRGTVTLTGLTLAGAVGFAAATNQQFTIFDNDGTDSVIGTFTGLAQNADVALGDQIFRVNYTGGTGNDVVLTKIADVHRPVLSIEKLAPASVRLRWATNDPLFRLQSNTNLNTTNWVSVSPLPVVLGTDYAVTNAVSGAQKLYRLVKP